MKQESDLFELIKTLNKQEKRYFKLFAVQNIKGDNNNYIKLFNAIEKQVQGSKKGNKYDERLIRKQFKGEIFIRQLHVTKNNLFKLILKSMRMYNSGKSVESELTEYLESMAFLYHRGLYKPFVKLLWKAKELAMASEKQLYMLELLEWERKLYINTVFEYHLKKEGKEEDLFTKQYKYISQYENIVRYKEIMHKAVSIQKKGSKNLSDYNVAYKQPLMSSEDKAISTEAKIYYNINKGGENSLSYNFEASYNHNKRVLSLFKNSPELQRRKQDVYVTQLCYSLIYHINSKNSKKYSESLEIIERLKNISIDSEPVQLKILEVTSSLEAYIYFHLGENKKSITALDEMIKKLARYESKVSKRGLFRICLHIFDMSFTHKNYSQALQYINKILAEPAYEEASDVACVFRILNLITHYEVGNKVVLEYLLKSSERFLSKRKQLYKFETIMIDFIKKNLVKDTSTDNFVNACKNLKKELHKIASDPNELTTLQYFDFISWIESKIQNKSFSEILKEKERTKLK